LGVGLFLGGCVTAGVAAPPDFSMTGYATVNGGTTGGAAGTTVIVSTLEEIQAHVGVRSGPRILQVRGTIDLGKSSVRIGDNKTIIGLGDDATLVGSLKAYRNNNIIIRNLRLTNPNRTGDKDGLTLQECLNVWVDHCTFVDCADGSLDIAHGADWITVSWCKFYYTEAANNHRFVNLIGHSDKNGGKDTGKLHVTFHHNWWGELCHERMPRLRFGRVHSFNNYFNAPGNNYCIRAARDSEVRLENNYFHDVRNPWEVYVTTGSKGKVFASGNELVGTSISASGGKSLLVPGTDVVFEPAYTYLLDEAKQVRDLVTKHAGSGKGPFSPMARLADGSATSE